MNNESHVGLVDTHAESNGGTNNLERCEIEGKEDTRERVAPHLAIVIGPLILYKLPFRIAETGMVRSRFDFVGC